MTKHSCQPAAMRCMTVQPLPAGRRKLSNGSADTGMGAGRPSQPKADPRPEPLCSHRNERLEFGGAGPSWPKLAEIARIGRGRPKSLQYWPLSPEIGESKKLVELARPKLVEIALMLTSLEFDVGRSVANVDPPSNVWPKSGTMRSKPASWPTEPTQPQIAPDLAKTNAIWAETLQLERKFDRNGRSLAEFRVNDDTNRPEVGRDRPHVDRTRAMRLEVAQNVVKSAPIRAQIVHIGSIASRIGRSLANDADSQQTWRELGKGGATSTNLFARHGPDWGHIALFWAWRR